MNKGINKYDMLYAQALFGDIRVSAATYDKIVDNIKNNPDKYPWEHALNSYPKETIDAYLKEVPPKRNIAKFNAPTKGLMALMGEAEPMVIDKSESLLDLLQKVGKAEREREEKRKAEVDRQRIIWNKHFDIAHDGGLFIIF